SSQVTGPITISGNTTVKARASFGTWAPSAIAQAQYTITPYMGAPSITDVVTRLKTNRVVVHFDRLMDTAAMGVTANFTINNGITVSAAELGEDGMSAALTTSALQTGLTYTLTVKNLSDVSHNALPNGTTKTFTFANFDPFVGLTAYFPFNGDSGANAHNAS